MITMKLKGAAGLTAAIEEMIACTSSRTAKARIEKGLLTAVQPCVERAKIYTAKHSGKTAASIRAGKRAAGKAAFAKTLRAGGSRAEAVTAQRSANRAAAANSPPVTVVVGADRKNQKKAILNEFGTKPHAIRPKRRGRMTWPKTAYGPAGGADVVQHPGTRPTKAMTRAFEDTQVEVADRIGDCVREQLEAGIQRARSKGLRKA